MKEFDNSLVIWYDVMNDQDKNDTGCFVWNFGISNGYSAKTVHILSNLGKAKRDWESVVFFFNIQKFV